MKQISNNLAAISLAVALAMIPFSASNAEQWRSASPKSKKAQSPNQQTMLELYEQIQTLQEELRELRNKVEVQENQVSRLQGRLRSVTQDLDRRVQGLERGGVANSSRKANKPSRSVAPVADGGDQKAYEAAFRLMKQGDYSRASRSFRRFLVKYPTSPLAGNAQYWIAESNYLVRNFKLALEEFQKVVKNHPNSRKVPDAMLKTGYSYYELRDYKRARTTLTEITHRYPNALVSRSAKSRLALMKKEGR